MTPPTRPQPPSRPQPPYEILELRVDPEPVSRRIAIDDRPGRASAIGYLVVGLAWVVGAILVALFIAGHTEPEEAPRGAPDPTASATGAVVQELPGAPLQVTPQPEVASPGGASQITVGVASWYNDGPGHYAAAPWWRSGMDPAPVSVCRIDAGRSDCITVVVQDHCQCFVGTDRERVIDLSPDAFAELAPLSAGLIRVQVDRGASPRITLPPTETAP